MSTIISTSVTPPVLPAIQVELENPSSKSDVQALSVIKCPKDTGKDRPPTNDFHPTLAVELLPKRETHRDETLYKSEPVAEQTTETPTAPPLPTKPIAESPSVNTAVKSTEDTPDLVDDDEKKRSAWARFRESLSHDPLNDPEFVEAYNDWKKRNRKERYERRRAWIRAHGSRLGRLVRLVDKKKSDEAWAAYQEKLAHMED